MLSKKSLLYHYCSNAAFWSIISGKKLRLSLLSMSNDQKEGQHIIEIAARLMPQDFAHKDKALDQLKNVMSRVSALGFCFSGDGDLLSPWRGYADDARGVSIGFDKSQLSLLAENESNEDLPVFLVPVAYDEDFLARTISGHVAKIVEHYDSGKLRAPSLPGLLSPHPEEEAAEEESRHKKAIRDLFWMLLSITNYAYGVKSPFFEEEREYRLLSPLASNEKGIMLSAPNFQPTLDSLRPFRDFPANGFACSIVKEIILGPKNKTPTEVAALFLRSQGLDHVEVKRSVGSYR